jgi:hypothetical protein
MEAKAKDELVERADVHALNSFAFAAVTFGGTVLLPLYVSLELLVPSYLDVLKLSRDTDNIS